MSVTNQLEYKVVAPHCCLLGEGPIWDPETKSIYWVDILNGNIHEYSTTRNIHRTMQVKEMVGAVAMGSEIAMCKLAGGDLSHH